ncbi:hypothetical protein niasHT_014545 [Heterodera trifolii]|uniref:Chromo domain-containing protein n=1 Tax=Heterodera trifolii TaxID=157864 RepID=A0ABD2L335_9BILA
MTTSCPDVEKEERDLEKEAQNATVKITIVTRLPQIYESMRPKNKLNRTMTRIWPFPTLVQLLNLLVLSLTLMMRIEVQLLPLLQHHPNEQKKTTKQQSKRANKRTKPKPLAVEIDEGNPDSRIAPDEHGRYLISKVHAEYIWKFLGWPGFEEWVQSKDCENMEQSNQFTELVTVEAIFDLMLNRPVAHHLAKIVETCPKYAQGRYKTGRKPLK